MQEIEELREAHTDNVSNCACELTHQLMRMIPATELVRDFFMESLSKGLGMINPASDEIHRDAVKEILCTIGACQVLMALLCGSTEQVEEISDAMKFAAYDSICEHNLRGDSSWAA